MAGGLRSAIELAGNVGPGIASTVAKIIEIAGRST
jgi:hypothetical protein